MATSPPVSPQQKASWSEPVESEDEVYDSDYEPEQYSRNYLNTSVTCRTQVRVQPTSSRISSIISQLNTGNCRGIRVVVETDDEESDDGEETTSDHRDDVFTSYFDSTEDEVESQVDLKTSNNPSKRPIETIVIDDNEEIDQEETKVDLTALRYQEGTVTSSESFSKHDGYIETVIIEDDEETDEAKVGVGEITSAYHHDDSISPNTVIPLGENDFIGYDPIEMKENYEKEKHVGVEFYEDPPIYIGSTPPVSYQLNSMTAGVGAEGEPEQTCHPEDSTTRPHVGGSHGPSLKLLDVHSLDVPQPTCFIPQPECIIPDEIISPDSSYEPLIAKMESVVSDNCIEEENDSCLSLESFHHEKSEPGAVLPGFDCEGTNEAVLPGFDCEGTNEAVLPGFDCEGTNEAVLPGFDCEGTNEAVLPGFDCEGTNVEGFSDAVVSSSVQPTLALKNTQLLLQTSNRPSQYIENQQSKQNTDNRVLRKVLDKMASRYLDLYAAELKKLYNHQNAEVDEESLESLLTLQLNNIRTRVRRKMRKNEKLLSRRSTERRHLSLLYSSLRRHESYNSDHLQSVEDAHRSRETNLTNLSAIEKSIFKEMEIEIHDKYPAIIQNLLDNSGQRFSNVSKNAKEFNVTPPFKNNRENLLEEGCGRQHRRRTCTSPESIVDLHSIKKEITDKLQVHLEEKHPQYVDLLEDSENTLKHFTENKLTAKLTRQNNNTKRIKHDILNHIKSQIDQMCFKSKNQMRVRRFQKSLVEAISFKIDRIFRQLLNNLVGSIAITEKTKLMFQNFKKSILEKVAVGIDPHRQTDKVQMEPTESQSQINTRIYTDSILRSVQMLIDERFPEIISDLMGSMQKSTDEISYTDTDSISSSSSSCSRSSCSSSSPSQESSTSSEDEHEVGKREKEETRREKKKWKENWTEEQNETNHSGSGVEPCQDSLSLTPLPPQHGTGQCIIHPAVSNLVTKKNVAEADTEQSNPDKRETNTDQMLFIERDVETLNAVQFILDMDKSPAAEESVIQGELRVFENPPEFPAVAPPDAPATTTDNKKKKKKWRKRRFQCEKCPKSFVWRKTLLKHVCNQFKCKGCGRRYKTFQELSKHEERCIPFRKRHGLYCQDCKLHFLTCQDFSLHQQVHTVLKSVRYKCGWCDSTFAHKGKLELHVAKCPRQPDATPLVVCFVCHHSTPNIEELKQHFMECHSGEMAQLEFSTSGETAGAVLTPGDTQQETLCIGPTVESGLFEDYSNLKAVPIHNVESGSTIGSTVHPQYHQQQLLSLSDLSPGIILEPVSQNGGSVEESILQNDAGVRESDSLNESVVAMYCPTETPLSELTLSNETTFTLSGSDLPSEIASTDIHLDEGGKVQMMPEQVITLSSETLPVDSINKNVSIPNGTQDILDRSLSPDNKIGHDKSESLSVYENRPDLTKDSGESNIDVNITHDHSYTDLEEPLSELLIFKDKRFGKVYSNSNKGVAKVIKGWSYAEACDPLMSSLRICAKCGKSFKQMADLKLHYLLNYICSICKKEFDNIYQVRRHANKEHFPRLEVPLPLQTTVETVNLDSTEEEDEQEDRMKRRPLILRKRKITKSNLESFLQPRHINGTQPKFPKDFHNEDSKG